MTKLLYRSVSLLVSVLGGLLAGAILKKFWQLKPGPDEAPKATDADRGWPEVLAAAALHGAVFAVVRAALDRATAVGAEKLTGSTRWLPLRGCRRPWG
jgi:hypothetical protein